MICGKMDAALKSLAREFGCTYTRYCDDITFSCDRVHFPPSLAVASGSGDQRQVLLGERLISVIADNGFVINDSKTRLLSQSDRQEVTGLTVNRFVNIPRKYIRNLRAALHAWRKFGLTAASDKFFADYENRTRDKADFQSIIFGRIQHVGAVRGFDDEIYRKLRVAFNLLSTTPIPLHEKSWEFKLENAIWVFECTYQRFENGEWVEDCGQGTAFFLESIGLVTCAHCVGEQNYIYQPNNPTEKVGVQVIAKSDDIDLAVLKPADEAFHPIAAFQSAHDSNAVQRGEKVVLAGFPSFGPGSHLSVKDGNIQSIKNKSGIRRFNISAAIIAGNSGGPVFNIRGQVIGVAVTGADSIAEAGNTEAHGVIPIAALEHLKPETN
jgi:S1-C subfamily serine protease